MTPHRAEVGYLNVRWPIALLLTSTRVVFAGRKFLRNADVINLARCDFGQYSEPQAVPDHYYVQTEHERRGIVRVYFGTREEALFLSDYFANG
jgi:hypothetical protein